MLDVLRGEWIEVPVGSTDRWIMFPSGAFGPIVEVNGSGFWEIRSWDGRQIRSGIFSLGGSEGAKRIAERHVDSKRPKLLGKWKLSCRNLGGSEVWVDPTEEVDFLEEISSGSPRWNRLAKIRVTRRLPLDRFEEIIVTCSIEGFNLCYLETLTRPSRIKEEKIG